MEGDEGGLAADPTAVRMRTKRKRNNILRQKCITICHSLIFGLRMLEIFDAEVMIYGWVLRSGVERLKWRHNVRIMQ